MFWRICKIVICQISKFQLDNVVDLKSAEKRAFSVFPFRPGNLGLSGVLLQLHAPKKKQKTRIYLQRLVPTQPTTSNVCRFFANFVKLTRPARSRDACAYGLDWGCSRREAEYTTNPPCVLYGPGLQHHQKSHPVKNSSRRRTPKTMICSRHATIADIVHGKISSGTQDTI